jgi:predicted MarR family transcription regulator
VRTLTKEIKEIEARLSKDIKGIELKISQVEASLHQAMTAQTRWFIAGLALLGVVLKLADLLLP